MPESNTQTNNQPDLPAEPEPEPSGPAEELVIDVANRHALEVSESQVQLIVRKIFEEFRWERGEVSIAIVDDPTIHELNREYLQHDYETDVLSFVFEQRSDDRFLSGEIIVSADTAARMAGEHGIGTIDELLLYVVHGALHLAGLDDKDESSRSKMRAEERRFMEMFEIAYRCPDQPESGTEAS